MSDIEFIPLTFKPPHDNAPDFVKYKVSFRREEMLAYCQASTDEYINGDVKESKGGKTYAQRDNWKPSGGERSGRPARTGGGGSSPPSKGDEPFPDDDIPF